MNRVVTGAGADGAAAVVFRGDPPAVHRSQKYVTTELWVTETTPARLRVDGDPSIGPYVLEPPRAGTRFRLVEIMPDEQVPVESAAESEQPAGEHVTDSLDYVVVVRGTVALLVAGEEILLGPGDAVVQNGVEHDWRNPGSEPCLLAAVLVGGERAAG